jgi:hypothetical protein
MFPLLWLEQRSGSITVSGFPDEHFIDNADLATIGYNDADRVVEPNGNARSLPDAPLVTRSVLVEQRDPGVIAIARSQGNPARSLCRNLVPVVFVTATDYRHVVERPGGTLRLIPHLDRYP